MIPLRAADSSWPDRDVLDKDTSDEIIGQVSGAGQAMTSRLCAVDDTRDVKQRSRNTPESYNLVIPQLRAESPAGDSLLLDL